MSIDFIYSGWIFFSFVEIFKIVIEDILVNIISNISFVVVYKSYMVCYVYWCVWY